MLVTARPKNIDGRWETNVGDINLVSNKLEFGNTHPAEKLAIRHGFRRSEYVIEVDLPTADGRKGRVHGRTGRTAVVADAFETDGLSLHYAN